MIERHFAKLRARGPLTDEEEQAIRSAVVEVRRHPADAMIVRAYDTQDHSTLLLDGILCRYKDLRNGQRQITELSCPLLSGPSTMTVWIEEGTTNASEEAQARGDHRQAA